MMPRPKKRQAAEKQWRFVTANGTCWRSLQTWMGGLSADVLFVQEHHLATVCKVQQATRWTRQGGWKAVLGRAKASAGGGSHGGTGVAVRAHIGAACWPGQATAEIYPGRLAGAWMSGYAAGGVALGSIYLEVGAGFGGGNAEVLQTAADALQAVQGPWILGGDWNIDAREMRASPWLECVRGAVIATSTPTCTAGLGARVIDYFVIDRRLLNFVRTVEVQMGSELATHRPVVMTLGGGAREELVMQLVRPRPFPVDLPQGCRWPPPITRVDDPPHLSMAERVKDWIADCEGELLVLFELAGDPNEAKYKGRADGPRFAKVCALGKPGSRHPVSTQRGRAARGVRSALEDLLAARSWGCGKLIADANWRLQRNRGAWARDGIPRTICSWLRHPSWLWDGELVQLLVDIRAVHAQEEARFLQQSRRDWKEWAWAAVKNGAKDGHRYCRPQVAEELNGTNADGSPQSPQQAVESLADEWAERWQEGQVQATHHWPVVVNLAPIPTALIREAAATFPKGTGMGLDSLHPRSLLLLTDGLLERLGRLFDDAELAGRLPTGMAGLLVHFIGKLGGVLDP